MSLSISERETIILFNDADIKAGFFYFSTTKKSNWTNFLKRIGGKEKLISVRYDLSINGEVRCHTAKTPVCYLSKKTFGIISKNKLKNKKFNEQGR